LRGAASETSFLAHRSKSNERVTDEQKLLRAGQARGRSRRAGIVFNRMNWMPVSA